MSGSKLLRGALAALFVVIAAGSANACTRAAVSGSDAPLGAKLNVALLDKAILSELNVQRCKAGLPALKASTDLRQVAEVHSRWMARTSKVSHQSTVAGQSTLKARLSSSGLRVRAGSENLAMVHRYALDGMQFRIRDASSCSFATAGGQAIPMHSYASLARHAVTLWMASSGHRRNILDRKVTMVGSAAALNASAPNCGQIFLSQNFAG
jgi:uncharacterized protein YkwD